MADGDVQQAPYAAVVALWRWLGAEWQWIDGHLTLRGLDLLDLLDRLTPDRITNLLYALLTDDHNGLVDRGEVRAVVSGYLDGTREADESPADEPETPTMATWGTSPEAQAGQEAMMRLLG